MFDDDAVLEHGDLGVAGARVRRFGADLVAHHHHPLDRLAAGQELGFGQDRRAAASGVAAVAAALPFGLQPGGAVDALDLVARRCRSRTCPWPGVPARARRCSADRPATGCHRCRRRNRTCGGGGVGGAWWRPRRSRCRPRRSSESSRRRRSRRPSRRRRRPTRPICRRRRASRLVGVRSARRGHGPAATPAATPPVGRTIALIVVAVAVSRRRRSRVESSESSASSARRFRVSILDRLGRDEKRHVLGASAGLRVSSISRDSGSSASPAAPASVAATVAATGRRRAGQQVAHADRVDAVHGGVRAADPAVEFGQRVEHLSAGRSQRPRQRMDPQPIGQVLVLRRVFWKLLRMGHRLSRILLKPPGASLSTRPREGFAMGPGHFSRACDGLAPSGSGRTHSVPV